MPKRYTPERVRDACKAVRRLKRYDSKLIDTLNRVHPYLLKLYANEHLEVTDDQCKDLSLLDIRVLEPTVTETFEFPMVEWRRGGERWLKGSIHLDGSKDWPFEQGVIRGENGAIYDGKTLEEIQLPPHARLVWRHDDTYLVGQFYPHYSLLTEDHVLIPMDGDMESIAILIRKKGEAPRLYGSTASLGRNYDIAMHCIGGDCKIIVTDMELEWTHLVRLPYDPMIVELTGPVVSWWDYSQETARKMTCTLFPDERELVGYTNLPTEMTDLVLEFLVPCFS